VNQRNSLLFFSFFFLPSPTHRQFLNPNNLFFFFSLSFLLRFLTFLRPALRQATAMAVVTRTTAAYTHRHLPRRHFDSKTKASAPPNTLTCSTWDSAKKASQRIVTRGGRVIVAASPPTEDAVVATDPLTKQDLVDYLASGCKPREKWRCPFHVSPFDFL